MALSNRTVRALDACYKSVVAPERWPEAMQSLVESLGAASGGLFFPHDSFASLPDSTAHQEFNDVWRHNQSHAPDPHLEPRCMPAAWPGRSWLIEDEFSTNEERRACPYYQEVARRAKREWWGATTFTVKDHACCLTLYRGADAGPFTPAEAQDFSKVGRSLAKLVSLAEAFASFHSASTLATLENARRAAIVIDGAGRAADMNQRARALLGGDLDLLWGRLVARDAASNLSLRRSVSAVIRDDRTNSGGRSGLTVFPSVVISRAGSPWILMEAMPLAAFGSDFFCSGRAIFLLTDLTSEARPDVALLCALFGLTAAEARVAAEIASGAGIDAAAARLNVSRETARSHLRIVFDKTGKRRQAELASLLARFPQGRQG
jgi:DNA-binding CsgD family transcriptional regulator/PAS domain-containing protein